MGEVISCYCLVQAVGEVLCVCRMGMGGASMGQ